MADHSKSRTPRRSSGISQLTLLNAHGAPHLDHRTRQIGRQGIAEARQVLRAAAERAAERENTAPRRRAA